MPDGFEKKLAFIDLSQGRQAKTWAIIAGTLFGIVRFSVGAIFVTMLPHRHEPPIRGVADVIWWAVLGAAVGAGLSGTWTWRSIQAMRPTKALGAVVGLLAGIGSYVGVAVVGAVFGAFFADGVGDGLIVAVGMSLVCGTGSALFTGVFVFPALAIAGFCMSIVQLRFTPTS
jgi:hypothetical protein